MITAWGQAHGLNAEGRVRIPMEAEIEYDDADNDVPRTDRSCSPLELDPVANGAGASATSDKVGI